MTTQPRVTGRNAGHAGAPRRPLQVGRVVRAAAVATSFGLAALGAASSPAVAASDSCSNAALRAQQPTENLGGCRAYELVSPADKHGHALDRTATVQGTPSGDAVAYAAQGAFGNAETSSIDNYYLSRRGPAGWTLDALDPPQHTTSKEVAKPTVLLTQGLETALQVSPLALAPGAIDGGGNIFRRDNLSGLRSVALGTTSHLVVNALGGISTSRDPFAWSADLTHFAFQTEAVLTPDAAPPIPGAGPASNVYEVVGDQIRLVNKLPDGSVDPKGGFMGSYLRRQTLRMMSSDGRRVFFSVAGGGSSLTDTLYMRVDGSTTIPIAVSRRAEDPPGTVMPAIYQGSSDDGTVVYFTSESPLLDNGSGFGLLGGNLYRLDLKSGSLEQVNLTPDPANISSKFQLVLAVSHDGSSMYFTSTNALAAGTVEGEHYLYRFDEGSGVRLVAHIAEDLLPSVTSDDLRYLVFTSFGQPTGFDNSDPACTSSATQGRPEGLCNEVYLYDADAATTPLRCLSCSHAQGGNRNSDLGYQLQSISQYTSRAALADGSVFFNSEEALVPADVNGQSDVYRWRDGVTTLISTGKSPQGSFFSEASADGRDVFFLTYEPLVGSDTDVEADLYDARVDGGITEQNRANQTTTPCDGDGCQGSASAVEGPLAPGSVGLVGLGDAVPLPPKGAVAAKVTVARVKTVRGTSTRITAKVSGKGTIRTSGSGLSPTTTKATKAGSYRVAVRLSVRARKTLRRKHRVTTQVTVRFSPAVGRSVSARVSVTFTAPSTHKAR